MTGETLTRFSCYGWLLRSLRKVKKLLGYWVGNLSNVWQLFASTSEDILFTGSHSFIDIGLCLHEKRSVHTTINYSLKDISICYRCFLDSLLWKILNESRRFVNFYRKLWICVNLSGFMRCCFTFPIVNNVFLGDVLKTLRIPAHSSSDNSVFWRILEVGRKWGQLIENESMTMEQVRDVFLDLKLVITSLFKEPLNNC